MAKFFTPSAAVGPVVKKTTTYDKIMSMMLDKIRPQIEAQIQNTNYFYAHYKSKGNSVVPGGKLNVPISVGAEAKKAANWMSQEAPVKRRRFEYVGGKHKKYWEIDSPFKDSPEEDWLVHVHYGRIGTDGQHHTKPFQSEWAAEQYYKKIVAEKEDKGYTEVFSSAKLKKVGKKYPVMLVKPDGPFSVNSTYECAHPTLANMGNGSFRCEDCHSIIDLGKKASEMPPLEVEKKAKRFINLNWRKE